MIHFGFAAKVVDVKKALLYGELEGEVYMECSPKIEVIGKDA